MKNLSAVSLTPVIDFRLFGYFSLVSMTPGKNITVGVVLAASGASDASDFGSWRYHSFGFK
jgi:hypothetical protein